MAQKRYGLLTEQPKKPSLRLSIFNSDSDSECESSMKKVIDVGPSQSQRRQARILQEHALKEDPTIFQYDELYDDMTASREEAKKVKATEKKESKYIDRLKLAADRRKKEYERRIERQVQKEREAEGDKYKDKESFVTSAYRAKLEEMRVAEELEKREEYLEAIGDVTKQRDLGGFYRHLYEQKLGSEKPKPEQPAPEAEKNDAPVEDVAPETIQKKHRSYRKRTSVEAVPEVEDQPADVESPEKKIHLQSNLDADSDFSIDSDSEDEKEAKQKAAEEKASDEVAVTDPKAIPPKDEFVRPESKPEPKPEPKPLSEVKDDIVEEPEVKPPPKPKVDIWKKRTVGDAFDEALLRYYERKQSRSG